MLCNIARPQYKNALKVISDIFILCLVKSVQNKRIKNAGAWAYSKVGSKEAGANAGAWAMRSKELVLSGILQALFISHLS